MARNFITLFCYLALICEIFFVPMVSSSTTCPKIHLENGTVKRRGRGKVVRFFCLRSFYLAGERYTTCIRGKWDPEPPKCVRATCKAVNQKPEAGVENLFIYPTHAGAVQHFFCKAGYILHGARDIYCNGSKWSDNMPTCLAANEKPKLSCDFETSDLCGWTHDLNHDFDWRRENYKTPSGSIGTGPSYDHTKGPGQSGYYMYIESSSRTENDTARLISPVYDKTSEDVCFQFYYHMFGATIGTLRVYLKTVNQSWDLQPNLAFFVKKGNQGDKWYRSYNYLGSIKNDFQIIIEGVRGSGYVSDIAIDDVKIIIGCVDEEDSTTTMDTSTYNEVIPTVDSCENRCDQRENETSNQYHLRCDCDQDCVDNNRCCPDFYDFCTGVSNDGETMTTDSIAYSTESSVKTISTTTTVGYKTTTQVAKPKLTTVAFTTKISKIVRPVVYIKTQPVTPAIFRKTITTTKLTPRTTKKLFPTTSKPHMVSKAVIPSTSSNQSITLNIIDTAETEVNDVIAIPNPMNNDEALYDGISASKENWSDEFENSLDTPYTRNFSESNKLFSQIQEKDSKSSFLAISIGICVGIISISVLVFVIVRRYRFSKRKLHSSNGESQSDVRYLTSDDILDLSIANNYEDLLVH